MSKIELIWPKLQAPSANDSSFDEEERKELNRISISVFRAEFFLTEAKQLYDLEMDRRSSAELKAQLYIGFIGSVVTIVLSILSIQGFELQFDQNYEYYILILVSIYVFANALAVAFWAFRAIRVSNLYRMDVSEIASAAGCVDPASFLVREYLKATLLNRKDVNEKTSCILMAQAHISRLFAGGVIFIIVYFLKFPIRIAVSALRHLLATC